MSHTDITIYTTPLCGYCYQAKKLLSAKGAQYTEINVMLSMAKRREMMTRSGRRTVPQIFIGDRHVGGYDELSALEHAGKLDPLLESAA